MARQYKSGLQMHAEMRAEFVRDMRKIRTAHRDLARHGLADYAELLAGGTSTKALARMGHPFGRRAPGVRVGIKSRRTYAARSRGYHPLLPINRQSGRLAGSIRIVQVPGKSGGGQAFNVGPGPSAGRSMYVLLPSGTRKMVPRGLYAKLEERWKARQRALIDALGRRN